jgi:hypothetical protein
MLDSFLALEAVFRPWNCMEPFEANHFVTRGADTEFADTNALQRVLDQTQLSPDLAKVSKHGFFERIPARDIRRISWTGIAECTHVPLRLLDYLAQFPLLFLQATPE